MDIKKLETYITNPDTITKESLLEIEDSLSKYPYCSTLHILYLKGLSNSNNIHFDEALRKSSVYVNDREQLFHILNAQTDTTQNEAISEDVQDVIKVVKVDDHQVPSSATEDENIPSNLESERPEINNEPEAQTPEDKSEHSQRDEVSSQYSTINEVAEQKELEKEIIVNAIDSALMFDVENIDKPEDSGNEKEAGIVINEPIELEFKPENEIKLDEPAEKEATNEDIDINNLSFSEWLKYKKTGRTETAYKNIEPSAKDELKFETKTEEKPIASEPKLTKKEINQLLDRFIEEEPRLSKPKKDFYNPLTNAKKSLDESDILVSETLAKIYHMQKNYSKAIKAYEQLSLLNPKKKSFFANQIKKIKKEELK